MGQMLLTGAGGGAANILASVPWVAQWKFNNNGNDSIGANNLTNNNSATFTTGKLGGATGATQLVRASSQYWSCNSATALQMGNNEFTLGLWLKLNSIPAESDIVSKWGAGGSEYVLRVMSDNSPLQWIVNGVTAESGNITTGVWYCILCWYDPTTQKNSIQVDDGTVSTYAGLIAGVAGTEQFQVGRRADGPFYTDGVVDNVCIAKSAAGGGGVLTAAQRTAFYNAGVGTETLS